MGKTVEILKSEYERMKDCLRDDALELARLRVENERMKRDAEKYHHVGLKYEEELAQLRLERDAAAKNLEMAVNALDEYRSIEGRCDVCKHFHGRCDECKREWRWACEENTEACTHEEELARLRRELEAAVKTTEKLIAKLISVSIAMERADEGSETE